MPLTTIQLTALKADILANSGIGGEFENVPNTPDGNEQIAQAYNAEAVPDYFVWRNELPKDEVTMSESNDGATTREFAWAGTGGFIARSVGEQNAWRELFESGGVNPSKKNTRQAFADIFSGGGSSAALNRAHLLAIAVRKSLRIEKLFAEIATGPGNDAGQPRGSRANPDAMTHVGTISRSDVETARNLPT